MCANCHRDPRQFFVYVLIHHLLVIFVHILSYQLLSLSLLRSRGDLFYSRMANIIRKKKPALSTAMFAANTCDMFSKRLCTFVDIYIYIYIYIYRASFFSQRKQRTCVEKLSIEQQQCGREIITRSKHVRDFKKKECRVGTFKMFKFVTENIGVNHTHTHTRLHLFATRNPILGHTSGNLHTHLASMSHTSVCVTHMCVCAYPFWWCEMNQHMLAHRKWRVCVSNHNATSNHELWIRWRVHVCDFISKRSRSARAHASLCASVFAACSQGVVIPWRYSQTLRHRS